jgi:hypothetical protein
MEEQGHTSRQDILEVAPVPASPEVAQRLDIEAGADVVMRRLRFVVDDLPVQLVRVYYRPELVAGSQLEQPVPIPDGVHGELRLPDADIRVLLQRTNDVKVSKERMHLDLEADDVEAEVQRLKALGATRYDHQQERGYDFWALRDPWSNEFCVLQPSFPELPAQRPPGAARPWQKGNSGEEVPQTRK